MRFTRGVTLCLFLTGCAAAPPPSERWNQAASGWSNSNAARPASDFLASCAAAVAQKVLLIKPEEREKSSELYAGVGRYMWLSCVASSPSHAHAQYLLEREERSAKVDSAIGTCAGDLDCLHRVNEDINGHLMRCLAYQRENASVIAGLAPATIAQCAKGKL